MQTALLVLIALLLAGGFTGISIQLRRIDMGLKDEFANLQAQVAAEETVEQSAITLLGGLKAQLDALGSQDTIDPADVKALADKIGTDTTTLAAAVTANTPAAPAATPAPTP